MNSQLGLAVSLFYSKKLGSPERPVRSLGNVMGNSRNLPVTLSPGTADTSRVTKVMLVSVWSLDWEICAERSREPASGREGCRRECVWHWATSALPLKISKMSIVPWRAVPSVINYGVVENIHRLAELVSDETHANN